VEWLAKVQANYVWSEWTNKHYLYGHKLIKLPTTGKAANQVIEQGKKEEVQISWISANTSKNN